MKADQKRFLTPLMLLVFCLSGLPISAQRAATKKTAKPAGRVPGTNLAQIDDSKAFATVEGLLQQTGQKYSTAGKGVWIVRRNGTNLKFFQIVLSYTSGMLITEVVVARGKSYRRLDEAAINLLRVANRLEFVKVSIDKDDDVFVRNEARLNSLDYEQFKANIERVASAADQVYVEVQSFR
jgi:hypothetical protein